MMQINGSHARWNWYLSSMVLCLLFLVGCTNSRQAKEEMMALDILATNFTDKEIAVFKLNDKMRIGGMLPYGGRSGTSCCFQLPQKWHEGLTIKVTWAGQLASKESGGETIWKEKWVAVPPYPEKIYKFGLVFLPNDEIAIDLVSNDKEMDKFPQAIKPPGWQLPTNLQRYCEGVKLINETPRQCFDRLVAAKKLNQDTDVVYPEYRWIDNSKLPSSKSSPVNAKGR